MPLSTGDKLGHYEILSLLGKGGMGEVYRGRDTKLKRDVAIKVLPETFARDAERMARFQREAEVLASLNHSNIAAIYGVEDRALVMELVEGASPKGPLPFDEAWKIAAQIAAALEYAHDKGIIHRDLKPANIMVTPEGVVKLLDFGLAKAFSNRGEARTASESPENSPTLTIGATEVGVILGTAAYMPPEQAKGKAVDKRADIWSFGVVLYELLTGERLFKGEDVSDTLAQVLTKQPDLDKAPAETRKLLRRCLEKDPKKRLRDIGDARDLLEPAHPSAGAEQGADRRVGMVGWGVAALVALALATLAFVHFREASAAAAEVRFQMPFPGTGANRGFRIAPNGRLIAYTSDADGTLRIYVHPVDSLAARTLPGTDNPRDLFWSPDSENIGFFADGKFKRVGLNGQPPQTLTPAADSRGGAWSPAGVIVFASGPNSPLYRIPDTGGTPAAATKAPPAGEGFRFPEFLPDGQHFLFYHASDAPDVAGIYAGSLDGMQPVRVLPDLGNAAFVPAETGKSGYIFFKREGALMAQAFDPINLRTSGGALSIADQIPFGFSNISWADLAAVPGVLAYVSDTADQNSADLVWVDRAGKKADALQGVFRLSDLSPDGTKVTFLRRDPRSTSQDPDLWVQDLTRGGTVRLTLTGAINSVWSPDRKRVAYGYRPQTGRTNFYLIPATGAAKPELLLEAAGQNAILHDWSLDGKWILYSNTNTGSGDLLLLPVEGDHKPVTYLPKASFRRLNAQFSPDGLWMAYQSDESGRNEIYVQAVPASSEKVTISSGGGVQPRWRRDGKELYYIAPGGKLISVTVKTGAKFEAGVPHQILEKLGSTNYAPTADGQKFIVSQPRAEGAAPPITVVLNWQTGLKK